jgi:hypothetical protein
MPIQHGRIEALRSCGPGGPVPRLSDQHLAAVEQALLEGANANGFTGELWTLDRIATVIERLTRVQRVRRTPHLADSFLRHAGLSVL